MEQERLSEGGILTSSFEGEWAGAARQGEGWGQSGQNSMVCAESPKFSVSGPSKVISGVGLGEARTLVGPGPRAELHLRFPETCWAETSRDQVCFLKGPGIQELKETQQVLVSPLSGVFMRGQVRQELPGPDLGPEHAQHRL